jgi:hypothetical protein
MSKKECDLDCKHRKNINSNGKKNASKEKNVSSNGNKKKTQCNTISL